MTRECPGPWERTGGPGLVPLSPSLQASLTMQGCECVSRYNLQLQHLGDKNADESAVCISTISTFDYHKTLIIGGLVAVSGAGIIAAVVAGLLFLLRVQIAAFSLQRAKKRGPPGLNSPPPPQPHPTRRHPPTHFFSISYTHLSSKKHNKFYGKSLNWINFMGGQCSDPG